jgi:hypothetical protein
MKTFHVALSRDIMLLPQLLTNSPERVVVKKYLHGDTYKLADLFRGPYRLVDDFGAVVLHGFDAKTNSPARLRIIDTPDPGTAQWCDQSNPVWGETFDSWVIIIFEG